MFTLLYTSFNKVETILTTRCKLDLLLGEDDSKLLLELKQNNLTNDYIKSLYGEKPEYINKYYITSQHHPKIRENVVVKENSLEAKVQFYKLYYVIKLKETGEIIGSLEIFDKDECLEFGLFIDQDHSQKGFGTEIMIAVIIFLQQYSKIKKLRWSCNKNNIRSISIAKKCGFVHDHDWIIYRNRIASTYYLNL